MAANLDDPMTAPSPLAAGHRGAPRPADGRRPGRPPRPIATNCSLALAGLGFGLVIGTVWVGETHGELVAPGGAFTAIGRLAGFTGAYLMLMMVLLMGRLPWLERTVGQDRLARWHRRIAPYAVGAIVVHVVTITLGYAELARTGVLRQLWVFLTSYPDLLAATVGFGLLMMAAVTSIRIARRKMAYETWWAVHLYTYLGLALAFAHQVVTGGDFVGHPLTRIAWEILWAASAGVVLAYRVGLPVVSNLRFRLKVVRVDEELPGVFTVICSGRRLDRLAVSGGQFFMWRFLVPGLWWQAHPYSLSALPRPPLIRVTIKALGDQSAAVSRLRPGTRVFVEGPYGAFTHHARVRDGVALIAAGVGVTPVRALLEELDRSSSVVVVLRASSADALIHRDELAAMVEEHRGTLHEVIGARSEVRFDERQLDRLVPDLAERDVFVCGPDSFSEGVVRAARNLGVPMEQIHHESFAF